MVGAQVKVSSRDGPDGSGRITLVDPYRFDIFSKTRFDCSGLFSTARSPDPPLCLGGEGLGLVVGRGGGDDLVSVLVDGSGLRGRELRLLLGLLLNLGNLLALLRRRRDLHTQNDVTDLRLSQGGHVHTKTR